MGWGDTDTQVRGPKSFSLQKHKPALFRFFSFCSALLCSHFSLPSVFFPFWAPRISYHSHPHCLMICKCRFISHLPFFFSSSLVVGECFLFFFPSSLFLFSGFALFVHQVRVWRVRGFSSVLFCSFLVFVFDDTEASEMGLWLIFSEVGWRAFWCGPCGRSGNVCRNCRNLVGEIGVWSLQWVVRSHVLRI